MVGAPVYSIAQGAALDVPMLLKHLQEVAVSTGGVPYSIRHSDRIREVFEGISNELKHGYLLAYRPPAAKDNEWRKIDVHVNGTKGFKVRAREGY